MQQASNFSPPQLGVLVIAAILLLLAIGLILRAPWVAYRLFSGQSSTWQKSPALPFWAKIWFIDLIACILLFTAVNALKWLPFLPIALKAGCIIVASLVFSSVSSWLALKRKADS